MTYMHTLNARYSAGIWQHVLALTNTELQFMFCMYAARRAELDACRMVHGKQKQIHSGQMVPWVFPAIRYLIFCILHVGMFLFFVCLFFLHINHHCCGFFLLIFFKFATGCESFLRRPSQISACAMQLPWYDVDVQMSTSLISHVLCNLKQTATTKTKQSRTSRGCLREPRCITQRKHRRFGAQADGLKSVCKSVVFIKTKARCVSRVSLRSKVHKYSAIVRECWRLLYLGFKFVLSQDLLMLFRETRFYSIAGSDGWAKLRRGK